MEQEFEIKDISKIDANNAFFHFTKKSNLDNIKKNGLEPRIGKNSIYVEKTKKVFFAQGENGILTIMDVWLRWLTSKQGISNAIYFLGIMYMKLPLCIKAIPNYVVKNSFKNKGKRETVYKNMKNDLDECVFLILDLEENVDFSYSDIDEVKDVYYESFLKLLYPNTSNVRDTKMEYWNMHTYSNKVIESSKISLLNIKDNISASDILKSLIEENIEEVKEKNQFLYEYYNYIYN